MPKRWNLPTGRVATRVRRAGARWGLQAGIVTLGGILAAGSLHQTAYLQKAPVMERVVASAQTPRFAVAPAVAASRAAGGLDIGMEHASIERWEKRLATPAFARLLTRKAKYEDMITAKLDAKQMPRDLIYLAMIESEFNPNAKSPVKAVGMWQFMAATARQFGLTVRGGTDERRDPARATDAALTYLASLKDRLGSWYLAAAAYNSGEGTVTRALQRVTGQKTGTDADFFRIMSVLPKETRDYVPKLIAAARVGNAPEQYGVTLASSDGEVVPVVPAVNVTSSEVVPVTKATAAKKATAKKSSARKSAAGKSRHHVTRKRVAVAKKKHTTTRRRVR